MKTIEVTLNEKRNVRLTAFIQDVGKEYRNITKRPGVLVIPGGGYMFCSDREAEPVALAYLNAGYDAFILRYTINEVGSWPDPLQDYEDAMEYIINHADEWNLMADKIAVAGFSAGGHLAGAAATIAKHKPAAAILGYAVLNEQVDEIATNAPRIVEEVNYDTCPCFLFAARTDNVVPIHNSIQMMDALDKAGVTFESHIYAYGPHGFSTGDESIQTRESAFCPRIPNWVKDSIGFLKDVMGDFYVGTAEDKVLTKPNCKAHITDDGAAWLSLDCTIGRIFGNPAAKEALADTIKVMKEKITPFRPDMTIEDMMTTLTKMKLLDLLQERSIDVDEEKLNEVLGKIPNI